MGGMIGSGRAAATGLGAVIGNNIQERNTNDVYLVSLRMDHGSLGQFDCSSIRRPARRAIACESRAGHCIASELKSWPGAARSACGRPVRTRSLRGAKVRQRTDGG